MQEQNEDLTFFRGELRMPTFYGAGVLLMSFEHFELSLFIEEVSGSAEDWELEIKVTTGKYHTKVVVQIFCKSFNCAQL